MTAVWCLVIVFSGTVARVISVMGRERVHSWMNSGTTTMKRVIYDVSIFVCFRGIHPHEGVTTHLLKRNHPLLLTHFQYIGMKLCIVIRLFY